MIFQSNEGSIVHQTFGYVIILRLAVITLALYFFTFYYLGVAKGEWKNRF